MTASWRSGGHRHHDPAPGLRGEEKVIAVEIDRALIPILQDTLSGWDNVKIINEDVMKVDLAKLAEEENGGKPLKVVANLPYYITTPIIMGLFENHVPLKEHHGHGAEGSGRSDAGGMGARRTTAPSPGDPVLREALYRGKCRPIASCPVPKVGSAVIRLERYEEPPVKVKTRNSCSGSSARHSTSAGKPWPTGLRTPRNWTSQRGDRSGHRGHREGARREGRDADTGRIRETGG